MKQRLIIIVRYTIQLVILAFYVYLFTNLSYPLEGHEDLLKKFSWLDPWGLINYIRSQGHIPLWIMLSFITIASAFILGRVFCGWFCPFGTLLMIIDKVSRFITERLRIGKIEKIRMRLIKRMQPYRYAWLIFLFLLFLFGINVAYMLTPFALFSDGIVKSLMGEIPWLLIIVIILTIFFSRIWCSVLCPTGLLLSVFSHKRIFRYQLKEGCVHCSKCSKVCALGADPLETGISKDNCIVCGDCTHACKTNAVVFKSSSYKKHRTEVESGTKSNSKKLTTEEKRNQLHTRRQFLKLSAAGLFAAAVVLGEKTVYAMKKVLRPPGSISEEAFASVCNRCGRCMKVCPNKALKPMSLENGIELYGTPYIKAREASCCLCFSCHEVCPTGAIKKVEFEHVHMGKAVLYKDRCLVWDQNKLCLICMEQCPTGAIKYDAQNRPVVHTELCVGCGSCEKCCAVKGEAAIRVTPK